MKNSIFFLAIFSFILACNITSETNAPLKTGPLKYLALGDSYTIGEAVSEAERWPVQLTKRLQKKDFPFDGPEIIAKTGWRTDELLLAMENQLKNEQYDLVSVLIGVNNQYQGKNIIVFQKEFEDILKEAIKRSRHGHETVFVVSIPDYGVTPFAKKSEKDKIGQEIDAYNAAAKKISEAYDVAFYNITEISRQAEANGNLIAEDGLHPSGKMYSEWVDKITPKVIGLLQAQNINTIKK